MVSCIGEDYCDFERVFGQEGGEVVEMVMKWIVGANIGRKLFVGQKLGCSKISL